MRFLNTDRSIGCVTVLKHEEIAEERLRTVKVCLFSKGRPEVKGAPYRLLCAIIEIVAKGRTHLGFGFDSADQCPLTDNEEILFFSGPEKSR